MTRWTLVDADNREAIIGTTYADFRGQRHILKGHLAPHKPGSSGRVYTDRGEYFPSVIGLRFRDDDTEDDTPEDVVDAINASLLARYERECGQ
jgi:hypothetical protein